MSNMASKPVSIMPLTSERRSAIPTSEAAHHLGRRPQTLRVWAMREDGPIRPIRVNGRLLWPTSEIRRLLGVEQ
jgi:hypothetical protein